MPAPVMTAPHAFSKPQSLLSARRLGWAGLAALVGCSLACALPFLAALGIGGGVLTALARVVKPGSELVVGGVVLVGALAVMGLRARTRARAGAGGGCGDACGVSRGTLASLGAGAGGTSNLPRSAKLFSRAADRGAPIACTADLTIAQLQIDGYRAAFAQLVAAERFLGGFRWKFRAVLGLESQLRGLAEREAGCCRFFSYDVTRAEDGIVWETRGGDNATAFLDEYFQLPQRLAEESRPGHDVALLKQTASAAGLSFPADGSIADGARQRPLS